MKLYDGLDEIERQLNHRPNKNKKQDVGDGKCEPIAVSIPISHLLSIPTQNEDTVSTNEKSKRPRITLDDPDITPDNPNVTLDDVDNCIIDLWDDVEPEVDPIAKILNRDLWLTNEDNDICELLESLITIEASPSDFVSFGGYTLIIIFMNKFKTNEFIMCKCCKLMAYLSEQMEMDFVHCILDDFRGMRCIVQCMNQFPKNLDIHAHCFDVLEKASRDNRGSGHLFLDAYKRKEMDDSLSGLQSVLLGMEESHSHVSIQTLGSDILWNIGDCKDHRVIIRKHGAISVLASAFDNYGIYNAVSAMKRLLEGE